MPNYQELAVQVAQAKNPHLTFDETGVVQIEDGGAYVQAWVRVEDADIIDLLKAPE